MSNSHFLSWSSHVVATLWKNSSCYCLPGRLLFLRLATYDMLKNQAASHQKSLFSENVVYNIIPTLNPTKCYKDISQDLYPTSRPYPDFFKSPSVFINFYHNFKISNFSCFGKQHCKEHCIQQSRCCFRLKQATGGTKYQPQNTRYIIFYYSSHSPLLKDVFSYLFKILIFLHMF